MWKWKRVVIGSWSPLRASGILSVLEPPGEQCVHYNTVSRLWKSAAVKKHFVAVFQVITVRPFLWCDLQSEHKCFSASTLHNNTLYASISAVSIYRKEGDILLKTITLFLFVHHPSLHVILKAEFNHSLENTCIHHRILSLWLPKGHDRMW